jgi:hypothetical protein
MANGLRLGHDVSLLRGRNDIQCKIAVKTKKQPSSFATLYSPSTLFSGRKDNMKGVAGQ